MAEQNNNGFPNVDQNPQGIDNNNFTNPETTPQDFGAPNQDFTQPNQDFAQGPAPSSAPDTGFENPQDFAAAPAQDFTSAPAQDFTAGPDTQEPPVSDFANTGFDQPADGVSGEGAPNPPFPNTFEEKKTGNRTFLIAAIVGVVILLILAVVLVVANLGSNNDDEPDPLPETTNSSTDTTTDTTPEVVEPVVDNSRTGGEGTPATNSRIYNETEVPTEWMLQKFRPPAIDRDGNCINISLCGANADQDSDGAETIDEYNYQLDPIVEDTDGDGISDGDELFIYYTNPSEDDTDSDGFTDGQEIANCFDPTELKVQLSSRKLSEIATNISLQKLHEPTITTLTDAGATAEDISSNGTIIANCNEAPSSTGSATDTTTDSGTNTTNDTSDSTTDDTTTGTTGVEVN